MKRFFLILTFVAPAFCTSTLAQSLSGKIIDEQTGEGIAAANVYVVNSSIGTSTNEEGVFSLKGISLPAEVMITHVSYDPQLITTEGTSLKAELVRSVQELDEVSVKSKRDRKWKRQLKRFEKSFFGASKLGKACEIQNPWVLNFDKEGSQFIARADHLLEVENKKTGYNIKIWLQKFIETDTEQTISAKAIFSSLGDRYAKIREETFLGSKRHFLHAMAYGDPVEEGFEVSHVKFNYSTGQFELIKELKNPQKIMDGNTIDFMGFLQVRYLNETFTTTEKTLSVRRPGDPFNNNPGIADQLVRAPQRSYLNIRRKGVPINKYGLVPHPNMMAERGYWSEIERAGYWLPFDYFPKDYQKRIESLSKEKKSQEVEYMNGFALTQLRIPKNAIKSGGPPRDGIPAIMKPTFTKKSDVFSNEDQILGIALHGEARAYPIKILNWHEAVNDKIGGENILVSFCPLCGSGVAFKSTIAGKTLTFGISGLLYNSDVLLYDHQTESLWSQLKGEAVSGPMSSQTFEMVDVSHTTWGEWKKRYPGSLIMSENTGYNRNYSRSPYGGYLKSDQLMFPVAHENEEIDRKSLVLGVELRGKHKAYPFKHLKPGKNMDTFQGEDIVIWYDETNHNAWLTETTTSEAKGTRLFWFAWYAFHPNTQIYK